MQAIYHMCPHHLVGEVLYPLNTLKHLHPDIYEREIAKYQDHPSRINLPQRVIPLLNCLWNDVVQCSPIHPHLLYLALRERDFPVQPDREFFQIPILMLPDVPIAIVSSSGNPAVPLHGKEVRLFDRTTYRELDAVPEKTLAWYDHLVQQKRLAGIFKGVPHIMIQGPIPIAQVRSKIRWGESPM